MQDTPVIRAKDADIASLLGKIKPAPIQKGHRYPKDRTTGEKYRYLNLVTAFDIETSKYQFGREQNDWKSWMYIWQWQIGHQATIIGRTWEEFMSFTSALNDYIDSHYDGDVRIMVYVHNLAFEFQFLAGVWDFSPSDVFATDDRSPLYCRMGHLELRCSMRLSNDNLDHWAKELRTDHHKLMGNLDYSLVRFPWTELTPEELAYCINDVICVVECVETLLSAHGDTLYTIPFTSTGYIRRLVKATIKMWCHNAVIGMQNDLRTYDRLRECFRGGDTHANRYWVGSILGDVHSYDRSSSYPDVICHEKFPMTKFRDEPPTFQRLQQLIDIGRACIFKVRFRNLRLKSRRTGNPYIPVDKAIMPGFKRPTHLMMDNGRVLFAEYLELAVTDIDFHIIDLTYDWDDDTDIEWMESARYGNLPRPFVDLVIKLYKDKTALKGVEGEEVRYAMFKALINSCYGMMCQRVITNPIVFENGVWEIKKDFDREGEYAKATKNAYLNYAWACYVTSHARYHLFLGIQIADALNPNCPISSFVYADTDSVKCRGELDFTKYNAERIRAAKRSGAWGVDAKGDTHYMGVFEDEGAYELFRTLGAKRYCVVHGEGKHKGELEITVAGVPKKRGSKALQEDGGIEKFDFNLVFDGFRTGKTGAVYSDDADEWHKVGDHLLHITRCVTIVEVDYSMTITKDYTQTLLIAEAYLDSINFSDYNKKW